MLVVITGTYDAAEQEAFRKQAPGAHVDFWPNLDNAQEDLGDVDGVIGSLPGELVAFAPKLKWIHSPAAGVNKELTPEVIESDIILTSSAGNGGIPLAEHAMMLMLMLNRSATRWIEAQHQQKWDRFVHGELKDKTVGIVGLGNAGSDLALKAQAFHMRVLGLRRRIERESPNVDQLFTPETFHQFLGECDFVVVTAPLTPATEGMFDEQAFAAMKQSAFFICISRGGIANDDALLNALREGEIAGAGLDAHGKEPLPSDSEFWRLPQVIITPHNGATTKETAERGRDIVLENLRRFAEGQQLLNVVDKEAGY